MGIEEVLGLDTMTALILTGLVMGGVEIVKRAFSKDWKGVITILVSAVIGGIAGLALNISALQGIAFGLAASGYVAFAQNIGKKSLGEAEDA